MMLRSSLLGHILCNSLSNFPSKILITGVMDLFLHGNDHVIRVCLVLKHCPSCQLRFLDSETFTTLRMQGWVLTEGKFLKCSSLGLGIEEEDTESFDGNPTYIDCEVFPCDGFKCDGVHVSASS